MSRSESALVGRSIALVLIGIATGVGAEDRQARLDAYLGSGSKPPALPA